MSILQELEQMLQIDEIGTIPSITNKFKNVLNLNKGEELRKIEGQKSFLQNKVAKSVLEYLIDRNVTISDILEYTGMQYEELVKILKKLQSLNLVTNSGRLWTSNVSKDVLKSLSVQDMTKEMQRELLKDQNIKLILHYIMKYGKNTSIENLQNYTGLKKSKVEMLLLKMQDAKLISIKDVDVVPLINIEDYNILID